MVAPVCCAAAVVVGDVSRLLWIFSGAVALVLLTRAPTWPKPAC